MKTGATIHTMNGLNMRVKRRSSDDPLVTSDGWWEDQHLSRGLTATGKPYDTEEDAAWTTSANSLSNKANDEEGKCPFH